MEVMLGALLLPWSFSSRIVVSNFSLSFDVSSRLFLPFSLSLRSSCIFISLPRSGPCFHMVGGKCLKTEWSCGSVKRWRIWGRRVFCQGREFGVLLVLGLLLCVPLMAHYLCCIPVASCCLWLDQLFQSLSFMDSSWIWTMGLFPLTLPVIVVGRIYSYWAVQVIEIH